MSDMDVTKLLDVPLVARKSDDLDDWYVIERRDHDGRVWMERRGPNAMGLQCSSRIGDADIEGHASEMLAIAEAIKAHRSASFRRCAVDVTGAGVLFWSPRNSQRYALVAYDRAAALADDIIRDLGGAGTTKE